MTKSDGPNANGSQAQSFRNHGEEVEARLAMRRIGCEGAQTVNDDLLRLARFREELTPEQWFAVCDTLSYDYRFTLSRMRAVAQSIANALGWRE